MLASLNFENRFGLIIAAALGRGYMLYAVQVEFFHASRKPLSQLPGDILKCRALTSGLMTRALAAPAGENRLAHTCTCTDITNSNDDDRLIDVEVPDCVDLNGVEDTPHILLSNPCQIE